MTEWSIREIQDIIVEKEEWVKNNLYATDSDKCPRGVYYSLTGEKQTSPDDPGGLRRMEVGTMIEFNQVKKLRALGIMIEAQRRIADEEHKVSGRHDGIIISPVECSKRAKDLIERKKEIFKELAAIDKKHYRDLADLQSEKISRGMFILNECNRVTEKQDLYDEDFHINKELLVPDPENSLMVIEIKSTTDVGFKYREREGVPSDSHKKQAMFYLWKLREIYPNIKARVLYVDTSYQNLLEFDVEVDEQTLDDMKKYWDYINHCVDKKELPPVAPDVVKDSRYNKWKVNYQAEWCKYHDKCTGDPDWLGKAIKKVAELNKKK